MYKIKREELIQELATLRNEYVELQDLRNRMLSGDETVDVDKVSDLSTTMSDRIIKIWIEATEVICDIDHNALEILDRLDELKK